MTGSSTSDKDSRRTHLLIEAAVLAVLWICFSGKLDALHLFYGFVSIVLVLAMTRTLVVARNRPADNTFLSRVHWASALTYPAWLLWQICLANLQVARIILSPRLPIDPVLVRFRPDLRTSLSRVVLGNSITLTPGTYTLEIEDGEFLVHAIDPSSAAGILDGTMPRRVGEVFGESGAISSDSRVSRPSPSGSAPHLEHVA